MNEYVKSRFLPYISQVLKKKADHYFIRLLAPARLTTKKAKSSTEGVLGF